MRQRCDPSHVRPAANPKGYGQRAGRPTSETAPVGAIGYGLLLEKLSSGALPTSLRHSVIEPLPTPTNTTTAVEAVQRQEENQAAEPPQSAPARDFAIEEELLVARLLAITEEYLSAYSAGQIGAEEALELSASAAAEYILRESGSDRELLAHLAAHTIKLLPPLGERLLAYVDVALRPPEAFPIERNPFGNPMGALIPLISATADAAFQRLCLLFNAAGPLAEGIWEGLSGTLTEETLVELAATFRDYTALSVFMAPVTGAGAAVGITEEVGGYFGLVAQFLDDPSELLDPAVALVEALTGPDGASFARSMGCEIGAGYASEIASWLRDGIVSFAYSLGRFVGPLVLEIIVAFIASGASVSAIAQRLVALLEDAIDLLPRGVRDRLRAVRDRIRTPRGGNDRSGGLSVVDDPDTSGGQSTDQGTRQQGTQQATSATEGGTSSDSEGENEASTETQAEQTQGNDWTPDALLQSANVPYRGGALTAAGRAATKHPEVAEVLLGRPVTGSPAELNALANEALALIIRDGAVTTPNLPRFGSVVEFRLPTGHGARFGADNSFIGFLDPLE